MKLEVIRSDLARGLSPEQIAATRPSLGVSKSTIYRWADEGYGGMSNMELRRKVGYKPAGGGSRGGGRRTPTAGRTRPSPRCRGTSGTAAGRWTPSRGAPGTPPSC